MIVSSRADATSPSGVLAEVPADEPEWLDLVAEAPDATVFHLPAWAHALAETYGFPTAVLVHRDATGRVIAGAPVARVRRLARRTLVSLPFTDACAPLARNDESLRSLADGLADWSRRQGVAVEVRGAVPSVPGWTQAVVGVEHFLDLHDGPESLRGRFSATHRRWLRQAERSGVRIRSGRSAADMQDFYELHMLTRRRQGVPVQPRRFFDAIWRHVVAPGHGIVLLAETPARRVVAGVVLLASNRIAMVKFQASDAAAWELRPNHLCYWAAVRWACDAGHRRLAFGRTETRHAGLQQWKAGWGGVAVPLTYAVTGGGSPDLGSGGVLDAVLGQVIRRSPALVCRALGALLYRYTA
ncbi:MAG TPA: GNAT family N-acetyltransferase [Candidatus Dormibacteraeota bacterium]|nr:GNAT family N-acetyltransferase [Candidatus Dormibacteraeota bacterium]